MAELIHVIHAGAATWSAIGALERMVARAPEVHHVALINDEDERLRMVGVAASIEPPNARVIKRAGGPVVAWDAPSHAWCQRHALDAFALPQDIPIDSNRLAPISERLHHDGRITIGWIGGDDDEEKTARSVSHLFTIITATAMAGFCVGGLQIYGPPIRESYFESLRASGLDASVTRTGLPPWRTIPTCDLIVLAPGATADSAMVQDLLAWCVACNTPFIKPADTGGDPSRGRFHLAQRIIDHLLTRSAAEPRREAAENSEFQAWLDDFLRETAR